MSRHGMIRRRGVGRLWLALGVGAAVAMATGPARGQSPADPAPVEGLPPADAMAGEAPAGIVVAELPPELQVVRFQGPEGVRVEVLGPPPEFVPTGDNQGLATVGLQVGVSYRLRVTNLPNRPGVELFPVIEVVGHLHRPPGIDPGRFPIRVVLGQDDFDDVVDRGRLVTQVVYLEDPEQALPLSFPKDEIPVVTLGPAEEPVRVGAALGRVMAIVRIGGRTPSPEESMGGPAEDVVPTACPFAGPPGGRCGVPCGPMRCVQPPPGRPWLPRDEYLCDGGDHAESAHFGAEGFLRGIDPRDAIVRFRADDRPRILPTNVVCIYAPRFAVVRAGIGPNEAQTVLVPQGTEIIQREAQAEVRQLARRFTQNQTAEAHRHRSRASGLAGRVYAGEHHEVRVLGSMNTATVLARHEMVQGPEVARNRQKGMFAQVTTGPVTVREAEGPVVTGIIQSAGQQVMAWKPQETAGVEVPPNKPGLAVVKRVSSGVAEPGEVVTFSIQFRNMGNVPIGSVSIIDSLLPRFEYVAGSARGPAGTVFTAAENRVGSTELRWDLPGAIAPGAEGYVSFEAKVR